MTEKNILESLVNVCGKVENVTRDKQGQVGNQKYKYATLESVLAVLQPLLEAEGLALVQYVEGDELVAKLAHKSGTTIDMGRYNLGALIDHQKRGSAITYGRRYQLCAIFGITQEDDDAASAGNVSKKKGYFPSLAERNRVLDRIEKQMDESASLSELKAIYDSNQKVFDALKESGNDGDELALEQMRNKYKAVKARIEEAEELAADGNRMMNEGVPR